MRAGDLQVGASNNDLFGLAERRLNWLDQRQLVLAQNIANANTPGYQARDLPDFARLLAHAQIAPSRTDPQHLGGTASPIGREAALPTIRAPDGNAVSVDGEMMKVAQDQTSANLVTGLWKSYMGMYMTALGKGTG